MTVLGVNSLQFTIAKLKHSLSLLLQEQAPKKKFSTIFTKITKKTCLKLPLTLSLIDQSITVLGVSSLQLTITKHKHSPSF